MARPVNLVLIPIMKPLGPLNGPINIVHGDDARALLVKVLQKSKQRRTEVRSWSRSASNSGKVSRGPARAAPLNGAATDFSTQFAPVQRAMAQDKV